MEPNETPRLKWPRYALLAVALFIILAVLWMSVIIRRTRAQGEWNPLPGQKPAPTSSH